MAMMDDDKDIGRGPDLNADDRPAPRRQEARLQVLRRQGAGHRLQGPAGAQVLHHRARQGRSPPHQRQLRAPPAQGAARRQARAQHRAPALHRHALRRRTPCLPTSRSSSSRTSTSSARAASSSAFARASRATSCFPRQLAVPATTAAVNRIEHEKTVALAQGREGEEGGARARRQARRARRQDRRTRPARTAASSARSPRRTSRPPSRRKGVDIDRKKIDLAESHQERRHVRDPGEARVRRVGDAQGGSRRQVDAIVELA